MRAGVTKWRVNALHNGASIRHSAGHFVLEHYRYVGSFGDVGKARQTRRLPAITYVWTSMATRPIFVFPVFLFCCISTRASSIFLSINWPSCF